MTEQSFPELFLQLVTDTRAQRYGWRRSTIDEQQREYIIAREKILEAIKAVQQIEWQLIDLNDREKAMLIRENVLHALATLVRTMIRNEEAMMWQSAWKPSEQTQRG